MGMNSSGIKNAEPIFHHALDDMSCEHIGKICYVYIAGIIVSSKDIDSGSKYEDEIR